MQRIFKSRYLFLGLALFAVWAIAKSRSTHEPTATNWNELSEVGSVDCTSGSCPCETCPCEVSETLAVVPATDVDWQDEKTCDRCPNSETLASDSVLNDDELAALGSQNDTLELVPENANVANDMLESVGEEFETSGLISERLPPVSDEVATLVSDTSNNDEEGVSSDAVVVNDHYQLADEGANAQKQSVKQWRKNPFMDQAIEPSLSVEAEPAQAPASVELPEMSILDEAAVDFGQRIETTDSSNFQAVQSNVVPASAAPARASSAPVSVQLADGVAQRAAHHIEYGKSLSRRGASHAARQEFIGALGVVAQANDAQTGGNGFTSALREAVMTLREAEDFMVANPARQIGMNVAHVVETHASKVVSLEEANRITPVQAMQRYFTVAQEQLDFAGGQNVVAAEALFCLGKLHSVMAQHQPEGLDVAKAIVFHRAALASDQQNFRSANELGVLLAQSGQLEDAADLMKRSLLIRQTPQTWQNLATVHRRMGQPQLAELAHGESLVSAQMEVMSHTATPIQWMPATEFNSLGPAEFHESTASATNAPQPVVAEQAEPQSNEKKSFSEKLNLKKWF